MMRPSVSLLLSSVVLVCLTVKAALNGMQTPIDIADTFYGTHFGDLQGWFQGCYAPQATVAPGESTPTLEVMPVSEPRALPAPGRSPEALLDQFDVGTSIGYENRYSDVAYWRIRGREQQLIDSLGGSQSDTHQPYRTENVQRGVAKDNPLGRLFHDAATKQWGQLHPYTGA